MVKADSEKTWPCISLRPPWPHLIFRSENPKLIEYRTWRPEEYGLKVPIETLLIHVSKTIETKVAKDYGIEVKESDLGVVFGAVRIDSVEFDGGQFAWHLSNRRRLINGPRISGQLGIFTVSKNLFRGLKSENLD